MSDWVKVPESEFDSFGPDEILAMLETPFEQHETFKRKGGGGREFTYIAGEAVIKRMNKATKGKWSSRLVGQPSVQILESSRWNQETRESVDVKVPCLMACVEVEIEGLGTHVGMGVQNLEPGAGEDVMKGVITDAMKNACKYFGVGLYLYGNPQVGAVTVAQNAPRQSYNAEPSSDDDPTYKQKGLISNLIREINNEDTVNSLMDDFGTRSVDELSRRTASQFIDRLKQMIESIR